MTSLFTDYLIAEAGYSANNKQGHMLIST